MSIRHIVGLILLFAFAAAAPCAPIVPPAEAELPVMRNLRLIVAPDAYYLHGESYTLAELPTALVQVPGLETLTMQVAPAAGTAGDLDLEAQRRVVERLARRYKIPEVVWIDPQPVGDAAAAGGSYIEWFYPGDNVSIVDIDWDGPLDSQAVALAFDPQTSTSRVRVAVRDPQVQSVRITDQLGGQPGQRRVRLTSVLREDDEPRRLRQEEFASVMLTSPPGVLFTEPRIGASNVPAGRVDIVVTFDREMGKGFSWTGDSEDKPPLAEGESVSWRDWQTCVYPAQLEPGRLYTLGINSKSHQNFKDLQGTPVAPMVIYFTTEGADEETLMKIRKPRVVKLEPAHGDFEVDPATTELKVTFDIPMGEGFSWAGGGQNYPQVRDDDPTTWSQDRLTCTLPVSLEPDKQYRLGINSLSHNNFRSAAGVPTDPQIYMFKTSKLPASETAEPPSAAE